MPGKLTWPTTKVTIEETCPEYLQVSLYTHSNILSVLLRAFIVCSSIWSVFLLHLSFVAFSKGAA